MYSLCRDRGWTPSAAASELPLRRPTATSATAQHPTASLQPFPTQDALSAPLNEHRSIVLPTVEEPSRSVRRKDGVDRIRAAKEPLRRALLHEAIGHGAHARPRQQETSGEAARDRARRLLCSRHGSPNDRQRHTQHAGDASRLGRAPRVCCLDVHSDACDTEVADPTMYADHLAGRRLTLRGEEYASAAPPAQHLRLSCAHCSGHTWWDVGRPSAPIGSAGATMAGSCEWTDVDDRANSSR